MTGVYGRDRGSGVPLKNIFDRPIYYPYTLVEVYGPLKKLKEYAGVIVALVTVMTALSSLGLWAIHAQIKPEIGRLDGRIESLTERVDRMDGRWETRFDRIEARFNRVESDIKTILLRLPKQQATR